MDVAVVGSQGRYFEVVSATGSLFCRTALWNCYGGKILTSFLRNFGIVIKETISSLKQCHSTVGNNSMTDKEQKESSSP